MFKLLLIASVGTSDLYLFHSIFLLNLDFKLINNLISSSLDKVTVGTYNLQLVILNVAPVASTVFPPSTFCACCKLVITQIFIPF